MKKIILLLSVAALYPGFAMAQTRVWNEMNDELKIALQTKGDAKRGEAHFEPCQGCHRKDASGRVSGAYPRLSGQHVSVLIKQIVDIRSGKRSNAKMEPFIDDHVLTPYEIADIAVFLNGLPVASTNGKGPAKELAKGKQLYDKVCKDCHGTSGEGDAESYYPMVAAQHYRYLLREVHFIRDGDRRNSNPDMVKVIKNFTDDDLESVADYMSQLPPPKK